MSELKFKIGDRVRIRDWDDMVNDPELALINGAIYYKTHDRVFFAKEMKHLCGRTATIEKINGTRVYLTDWSCESGDLDWAFDEFMIEKVDDVSEDKPRSHDIDELYARTKYNPILLKIQTIEECSELVQAVCKSLRKTFEDITLKLDQDIDDHLKEEIADVQVCLWQLMKLTGVDAVDSYIDQKIERTLKRMDAGDES